MNNQNMKKIITMRLVKTIDRLAKFITFLITVGNPHYWMSLIDSILLFLELHNFLLHAFNDGFQVTNDVLKNAILNGEIVNLVTHPGRRIRCRIQPSDQLF